MLGKLLKYDLKWIYKVIVIFYVLAFVFSVAARICFSIENSTLFNILGQISAGIAISMIINSIINCLMRSWVRFMRNIYKDESYLTHTLPVSKNKIYSSKVLAAIICTFTSVIATILVMVICYYSKENIQFLKQALQLAANVYDTTVMSLLLIVFLVVFLEIIFIILIGYTGIILGHKSNKNKMLRSVGISFGLYIITQVITILVILGVGMINVDVMNIINTTDVVSVNAIKTLMYLAVIIYVIYNIAYYLIGRHMLNKGVNID